MRHNENQDECEEIRIIVCHPKGLIMSQVQFSATFHVAPATQPNPLAVTPQSGEFNLQVGVAADGTQVAVVSGGKAPYNYALDPQSGSLPTGVDFAEDGNGNITLTGTPTVEGDSTSPVLLNITDADGVQLQAKFRTIARK